MPDYRFYHLSAGRIVNAEVHSCADDETAQLKARLILETALPPCDAVEVWQLARLVGAVQR
jgi:hypothetical protein